MPTSPSASMTAGSPLSVSLIRTSRIAGRSLRAAEGAQKIHLVPASEGPVAADPGLVLWLRCPGGSGIRGGGEGFAARPAGACPDLFVGGPAGALLALFGLLADPVGLGLELVLGAV